MRTMAQGQWHPEINQEIVNILTETNGDKYNIHKASEECQELGLVLNQYLLKPTKVDKQEIVDEIGDVLIRIQILMNMGLVSEEDVQKRIEHKLSKYQGYLDHKLYNQI